MTRLHLGIVTMLAAVVMMACLPIVLSAPTVLLWWIAMAVLVVGAVSVARAVMES